MAKYIKELRGSMALKREYLDEYLKPKRAEAKAKGVSLKDVGALSYARWIRRVKEVKGTEPGVDPKNKSKTTGTLGTVKKTQSAKMKAIREGTGRRYGAR
jgi:hypothetical protein